MTAVDHLACAPSGSYPTPSWGRPNPPDPILARLPNSTCRVLVAGPDDERVRWALTQVWRAAGRPLVVTHAVCTPAGRAACRWARDHHLAGVRCERVGAATAGGADVILVCGWSAALRVAVPVARRAGIDVVDAATIGEFDPVGRAD